MTHGAAQTIFDKLGVDNRASAMLNQTCADARTGGAA